MNLSVAENNEKKKSVWCLVDDFVQKNVQATKCMNKLKKYFYIEATKKIVFVLFLVGNSSPTAKINNNNQKERIHFYVPS